MQPAHAAREPLADAADPRLYVARSSSEAALAGLRRWLGGRGRLAVLAGAPGAGTTLVLRVLEQSERSRRRVLFSPFLHIEPEALERWLVSLAPRGASLVAADPLLAAFGLDARPGLPPLLIVDDAQAAAPEALEALGRLARERVPSLKVVLGGCAGRALREAEAAFGAETTRFELPPWTPEELRALCAAICAHPGLDAQARARLRGVDLGSLASGAHGSVRLLKNALVMRCAAPRPEARPVPASEPAPAAPGVVAAPAAPRGPEPPPAAAPEPEPPAAAEPEPPPAPLEPPPAAPASNAMEEPVPAAPAPPAVVTPPSDAARPVTQVEALPAPPPAPPLARLPALAGSPGVARAKPPPASDARRSKTEGTRAEAPREPASARSVAPRRSRPSVLSAFLSGFTQPPRTRAPVRKLTGSAPAAPAPAPTGDEPAPRAPAPEPTRTATPAAAAARRPTRPPGPEAKPAPPTPAPAASPPQAGSPPPTPASPPQASPPPTPASPPTAPPAQKPVQTAVPSRPHAPAPKPPRIAAPAASEPAPSRPPGPDAKPAPPPARAPAASKPPAAASGRPTRAPTFPPAQKPARTAARAGTAPPRPPPPASRPARTAASAPPRPLPPTRRPRRPVRPPRRRSGGSRIAYAFAVALAVTAGAGVGLFAGSRYDGDLSLPDWPELLETEAALPAPAPDVAAAPPGPAPAPVPPPEPPAAEPQRWSVQVNAQPWAWIRIDGEEVGATPLLARGLVSGPHEFQARFPDGREERRVVEIGPESRFVSFR